MLTERGVRTVLEDNALLDSVPKSCVLTNRSVMKNTGSENNVVVDSWMCRLMTSTRIHLELRVLDHFLSLSLIKRGL
jgi:hypothetical protein